MAAKDDLGKAGEATAAEYLAAHGHRIVDRNWRCVEGEIDLVTEHRGEIVIVEVKTRRSLAFGDPLTAVDTRKLRRLWRLARAWCIAHPDVGGHKPVRVDVVGITGDAERGFDVQVLADVR